MPIVYLYYSSNNSKITDQVLKNMVNELSTIVAEVLTTGQNFFPPEHIDVFVVPLDPASKISGGDIRIIISSHGEKEENLSGILHSVAIQLKEKIKTEITGTIYIEVPTRYRKYFKLRGDLM